MDIDWSKLIVGSTVVAIRDVPCPIQQTETQFFKDKLYKIVEADDDTITLDYSCETNSKPSLSKFSRKQGQRFDFIGDWFEPAFVFLQIIKAAVLLSVSTDKVILHTDLPCPFTKEYLPSQPKLSVSFEATYDTGIEYVRQNFSIEPEVINTRHIGDCR